jgi:hypothetical protein
MEKTNQVWDFVEKYYPNYSSSWTISMFNSIQKIMDDEFEDDDDAAFLLRTHYEGNLRNSQIELDYNESLKNIYYDAIEGYIKHHSLRE